MNVKKSADNNKLAEIRKTAKDQEAIRIASIVERQRGAVLDAMKSRDMNEVWDSLVHLLDGVQELVHKVKQDA